MFSEKKFLQILDKFAVGAVRGVLVGGLGIVGGIAEGDEEHGTYVGGQAEALDGLGDVEVTHGAGAYAQVGGFEEDVGEDDGAVDVAEAVVVATLACTLFVAADEEGMGCTVHAGTEGVGLGYSVFGTEDVNLLGLAVDSRGSELGGVEDEVDLLLFHRRGGEVTDGVTVGSELKEIFVHDCFCLGFGRCGLFGGVAACAEAKHAHEGGDEDGCFHNALSCSKMKE